MTTKKEVIDYLIKGVSEMMPVAVVNKQVKSGTVIFGIENNCKIIFLFDTVMAGKSGKNSFVISFNMSIHNPFFAKVRKESFNVQDDNPNTTDLVLSLDYLRNLPKEWDVYDRYMFSDNRDRNNTADGLLRDIKDFFMPYVKPFAGDYKKIVDNYSNPNFVRNIGNWWQFLTGTIAAILTGQEEKIEEAIVPLAQQNTNRIEFLEFKRAKDYKKELIEPIKEYITSNNLSFK